MILILVSSQTKLVDATLRRPREAGIFLVSYRPECIPSGPLLFAGVWEDFVPLTVTRSGTDGVWRHN
jgi:hypothetical protein